MASRSSSPNPSRPKTPDNAALRRSTGSITPSKPTAESHRILASSPRTPETNSSFIRRSTGTESPRYKASRDLLPSLRDNNENEREPDSLKTPKPVKRFMAPTISAASKIISASPRKRVLGEKNEVVGVPVSHSFEEVKRSEVGSGFWDVLGSPDARKPEMEVRSYKHVASPSFTPTPVAAVNDGDPMELPYDPKTNPLAPRPKFLYYKPSPRELLVGNGEGVNGDDLFSSESFEGTDENTEDTTSDLREEAVSGVQRKDEGEEDVMSVTEVEEEDEDEDLVNDVSEPEIQLKRNGNHFRSRSFTWLKTMPLLFMVIIACLYAPLSDFPLLESSRSSALENLNGAASRLREWSSEYVAYLTAPSSLPNGFGSYDSVNLTFPSIDQCVDSDFIFSSENQNQVIKEAVVEGIDILVGTEEDGHANYVQENDVEVDGMDEHEGDETDPLESENEEESVNVLILESTPINYDEEPDFEDEIRMEEHKEEEHNSVAEDVKEEINYVEDEMMTDEVCVKNSEQEWFDFGHDDISRMGVEIVEEYKDTSLGLAINSETIHDQDIEILDGYYKHFDFGSMRSVLGLSVALIVVAISLIVVATSAVILYMKRKTTSDNKGPQPEVEVSVSGSSFSFDAAKKYSESKDIIGDSSTSEANSYLPSTPGFGKESSKSNERKARRDSPASSSVSYGSFTTTEKISIKKGYRDVEVVTPVRRSSRIKHQAASPSQ